MKKSPQVQNFFLRKFFPIRGIYPWKSQHACLADDDLHLQSKEFDQCLSTIRKGFKSLTTKQRHKIKRKIKNCNIAIQTFKQMAEYIRASNRSSPCKFSSNSWRTNSSYRNNTYMISNKTLGDHEDIQSLETSTLIKLVR